jgi:CBS domain-containing protein
MPLSRVYRYFNEIGIRHLPVLDAQHRLSGFITRKDLRVKNMEAAILKLADLSELTLKKRGGRSGSSAPSESSAGDSDSVYTDSVRDDISVGSWRDDVSDTSGVSFEDARKGSGIRTSGSGLQFALVIDDEQNLGDMEALTAQKAPLPEVVSSSRDDGPTGSFEKKKDSFKKLFGRRNNKSSGSGAATSTTDDEQRAGTLDDLRT